VLYGGSGANYIQPNYNGGLATIQVHDHANNATYDSTAPGDSLAVDPDAGYGGRFALSHADRPVSSHCWVRDA